MKKSNLTFAIIFKNWLKSIYLFNGDMFTIGMASDEPSAQASTSWNKKYWNARKKAVTSVAERGRYWTYFPIQISGTSPSFLALLKYVVDLNPPPSPAMDPETSILVNKTPSVGRHPDQQNPASPSINPKRVTISTKETSGLIKPTAQKPETGNEYIYFFCIQRWKS